MKAIKSPLEVYSLQKFDNHGTPKQPLQQDKYLFVLELNMLNKNHPGGLFKLEFSLSIEMMEASLS